MVRGYNNPLPIFEIFFSSYLVTNPSIFNFVFKNKKSKYIIIYPCFINFIKTPKIATISFIKKDLGFKFKNDY